MKQYIVKRAYGTHRVGAIIEPTGLTREELLSMGYIAPYTPPAPVVVAEPEPEVIEAVAPVQQAIRRRGRPRKWD